MRAARRFWRRLFGWTTTARDEERLRLEMEEHIALQMEEYIDAGAAEDEARRRAMLKFGAVEAWKGAYRDERRLPVMEAIGQDLRQAWRRLRKAPAFTVTALLTLALGLGATTSIFTLVHAVLLKSLPVAKPDELYRLGRETHCCVWGGFSQYKEFSIVSTELYGYLHDHTQGFVELAGFSAGGGPSIAARRANAAEAIQSYPSEFVSGNYFAMFGIPAYAGRMLGHRDDQPDAASVAVMSFRLWQEKYGADAAVIGSVFNLNDKPVTIVGITPPGFFGETLRDTPADFYLPIADEPLIQGENSILRVPDAHWLDVIGRIRPGISAGTLESQMRVELKQWLRSHWGEMGEIDRKLLPRQTLYLSPGGGGITSMREAYERWLQILMMASGFVLLIVCANVGSLVLVRGMERRQEMSLSMALGARGSRLVSAAMTESVLLSFLGGLLGLAVSYGGTQLILRFAFERTAGLASVPIDASPSMAVLFFAFAIALVVGLLFGMAPAWMATRVDPIEALRGANRSTAKSASVPRRVLVIGQAALSLVLVSAAGLLTKGLLDLEKQDFGFVQEGRTVVGIDPQVAGYKAEQLEALYRRIYEELGKVRGVSALTLCSYSPQSGGNWNDGVFIDGQAAPGPNDEHFAGFTRVTPGFFEVIGNRILRGRTLLEQDTEQTRHVAVVNEVFVKKFFKQQDPIGQHFGRSEAGATRLYEIVGVARNARYLTYGYEQPIGAFFFLPEAQHDVFPRDEFTKGDVRSHYMHDIVIVSRPGMSIETADLRRGLANVDPNLPVNFIHGLSEQVADQFRQQRLVARLTSFFGLLSLTLVAVGFYGVTAYNAGRRVKEIGVRVALGASRQNVLTLVLRGALGLLGIGLLLGVPLSLAAAQLMSSRLYQLGPYDLPATAAAAIVLGLAAVAAALIPALRASSISPLQSLRAE